MPKNLIVDEEEIVVRAMQKRLGDFRYKHRFPTGVAAIKWLLARALDQKPAVAKGE